MRGKKITEQSVVDGYATAIEEAIAGLVKKAVPVSVSGISLSEETASLAAGQTKQLAATVLPANAANKTVSWSSSNPGVAEVSANGLVTAKAVGTAVITATTADGAKTASCTVTVTAKIGTARTVGAARVKVTGAGEAAYTAPKSKTAKSAVIPATVKIGGQTYKVTSVAENAFKNNKRITKVTISKNVKTIGKSAFYGCSRLSRVTVGRSVETIGDYAFYGNKRLKTVSLPASVKSIGKSAFRGLHRTDEDHAGQERDKDQYGGVLRGQEAENDCNQLHKAEKRGETGI